MPDQQSSQGPSGNPDKQPFSPPPIEPTIEQRIMALEANSCTDAKNDKSDSLVKVVKTSELWMIGINGLTFIATIFIAYIYFQQLSQMRIATQASTAAVDLANRALLNSTSQFERNMRQIVDQTIIQYDSAQATKDAAQTSSNNFEDTVRPYVGIENILISEPAMKRGFVRYQVILKNFGSIPATGADFKHKLFSDGKEILSEPTKNRPSVLNPGATFSTQGMFPANEIGDLYLRWNYHWRNHAVDTCEKEQYNAAAMRFIDLGPLCGKWDDIAQRYSKK
jgi:hypothetical protein